ncbi:MAG: hypothetical protein KDJ52_15115 [Anaerolineae bacterium]|nr:hypothetical protein [Anaerolineae bacterium]
MGKVAVGDGGKGVSAGIKVAVGVMGVLVAAVVGDGGKGVSVGIKVAVGIMGVLVIVAVGVWGTAEISDFETIIPVTTVIAAKLRKKKRSVQNKTLVLLIIRYVSPVG